MNFYVYLIISKGSKRYISYVGYAKNVKKRIILHNLSKGAKFTKGKKWYLVYKKKYSNKTLAMKEEYKLKKDKKKRKYLKEQYIQKNENCNITSI